MLSNVTCALALHTDACWPLSCWVNGLSCYRAAVGGQLAGEGQGGPQKDELPTVHELIKKIRHPEEKRKIADLVSELLRGPPRSLLPNGLFCAKRCSSVTACARFYCSSRYKRQEELIAEDEAKEQELRQKKLVVDASPLSPATPGAPHQEMGSAAVAGGCAACLQVCVANSQDTSSYASARLHQGSTRHTEQKRFAYA